MRTVGAEEIEKLHVGAGFSPHKLELLQSLQHCAG
jgi:hypothetical protein